MKNDYNFSQTLFGYNKGQVEVSLLANETQNRWKITDIQMRIDDLEWQNKLLKEQCEEFETRSAGLRQMVEALDKGNDRLQETGVVPDTDPAESACAQTGAVRSENIQSGDARSKDAQDEAARSEDIQNENAQSEDAQSKADQSAGIQNENAQSEDAQNKAVQDEVVQSEAVRSEDIRSGMNADAAQGVRAEPGNAGEAAPELWDDLPDIDEKPRQDEKPRAVPAEETDFWGVDWDEAVAEKQDASYKNRAVEPPARQAEPESADTRIAADGEHLPPSGEKELVKSKYLFGKVTGADLLDGSGNVLIPKNTKIDDEVAAKADSAGKLAELIINMTVPGIEREP